MKLRILFAVGSLLTLGTAVAGTLLYGANNEPAAAEATYVQGSSAEPTAQMLAHWRATAISTEYLPPKAPI